jgi:hypothetical protein
MLAIAGGTVITQLIIGPTVTGLGVGDELVSMILMDNKPIVSGHPWGSCISDPSDQKTEEPFTIYHRWMKMGMVRLPHCPAPTG